MTTIYHNPRCSKSRATLALLHEQNIEPEIILYLESPPDVQLLERIVDQLDCSVRELIRTGEPEYRDLGLSSPDLTDTELLAAISANPKLLQRPIVVNNEKAAVGRPPENILTIL